MLLRRQLFIVVLGFMFGSSTAVAAGLWHPDRLPMPGAPVEFEPPVSVGDSLPDTGKFTSQQRSADAGPVVHQRAAGEPKNGAMYVLGFSLIGFAIVARRRSYPETNAT